MRTNWQESSAIVSSTDDSTDQSTATAIAHTADPIVIVCSADENYAMPMAVMLYSAWTNLKNKQRPLWIYILDGGIFSYTREKIARTLNAPQIRLHWVEPDHSLFQGIELTLHFTIAAYYRLLMSEILPQHLTKAIYLDCDMIVRGDLEALWQMEIGDHYVLAVHDDNHLHISDVPGLSNYRELGLNPDQKYFNSGLLVVNLQKWRADQIGKKVLTFSRENKDYIQAADQDGLNAVLAGKWGELNPRWNQMPRIYTYHSWQESPYDEADYIALRNRPHIIHYTNAAKPWWGMSQHPAQHQFFHYLEQTAWAGWRHTFWQRIFRKIRKEFYIAKMKLIR